MPSFQRLPRGESLQDLSSSLLLPVTSIDMDHIPDIPCGAPWPARSTARHVADKDRKPFLSYLSHYLFPCHLALTLLLLCLLLIFHVSSHRPRIDLILPEIVARNAADIAVENAADISVRLVRMKFSASKEVDARQDERGWMVDPVLAARKAGLEGGSLNCLEAHLGQIKAGKMRGNHRHHHCNETFILWGARQRFRNENPNDPKGYSETILEADDVAVATGPAGFAHSITNIDSSKISYLMACQDALYDLANPRTDYNVWSDL